MNKPDGNMFWDADQPEEGGKGSIDSLVVHAWENGVEAGSEITVQRAIRLPDIRVRIIEDEHGDPDYEVIAEKPKGDLDQLEVDASELEEIASLGREYA